MLGLYDLLAAGVPEDDVAAWLGGAEVGRLPRLSARERRSLEFAWWFWARPGQHWRPGPEFITAHEGGRGSGKAVSLDTPLVTPTGWTTMGQVQVGDRLIDEMGRPCSVTAVHNVDAREAWRLHFSDGSHVDACADHLWVTLDQLDRKRMNRRMGQMMAMWAYAPARTTREVVATLHRGTRGDLNHCIPLASPLVLPDAGLIVDPYVLGIWLGDGNSGSVNLTAHQDDWEHYRVRVEGCGLPWRRQKIDESRSHIGHYRIGEPKVTFKAFKALGVINNKHIPAEYLRASFHQRLALMQGLIDTDGTVDKESGQIEFCSMLERLAEDVAELARTLGQKPVVTAGRALLNGTDYGTKYRVFWRPTLQVASLPRKVALIQRMGGQAVRNQHRMIVGADPLPPQPMRCVSVDSPARMYLVGKGMIPTHNSWAARSAIYDAANDPERWGGHAVIAGPDPAAIDSDMLHGLSGIVSCGHGLVEAGLLPPFVYNPSKLRITFRHPRGGGDGLTVMIRASSNPKGGRGPNVGLAWFDEFGVWYHDRVDAQSKNLYRSIRPAVRAGVPNSRIIVTMTPSRVPEVRELQADAERPECPRCRLDWLAEHGGKYTGERLKEPWRLPRSPQERLHPDLNSRTTLPARECPTCGGEVVAKVRTVFFDTRDNPHTDADSRARATEELSTGLASARQEFAPIGEADATVEGSLVREECVARWDFEAPTWQGLSTQVPDRWTLALRAAGVAPGDVVVFVDPAVTSTGSSDESGVVASGLAEGAGKEGRDRSVGLQDWSVRPDEVEGAPSAVWAPRAWRLAVLWGASRVVVEVNQGGDEVLSAVRDLVARPLSEAQALALLREEFPGASDARLGLLARRVAASSRGLVVEFVRRLAPKPARVEWYGRTAALGQQAVLCCDWLGGARHWQTPLAQLAGYEPPREGAPASAKRGRKDRGDALVAGAQVNLGVRETARGEVEQAGGGGWLGKVGQVRG